jgi:hypothetical protein
MVKRGGALSPSYFNFALECTVRKVQENTTKKYTTLLGVGKEVGLEVNIEKSMFYVSSPECRTKS